MTAITPTELASWKNLLTRRTTTLRERAERAEAEVAALRKDLLTAHLMVAKDAFDSPGRMTSAIRPFLAGVVERHGITLDDNSSEDTP